VTMKRLKMNGQSIGWVLEALGFRRTVLLCRQEIYYLEVDCYDSMEGDSEPYTVSVEVVMKISNSINSLLSLPLPIKSSSVLLP
jgi:hypothetical protein